MAEQFEYKTLHLEVTDDAQGVLNKLGTEGWDVVSHQGRNMILKRRQDWDGGVGTGRTDGYCVCPRCGFRTQSVRGTPCSAMKCPVCATPMVGTPMEPEPKPGEAQAMTPQVMPPLTPGERGSIHAALNRIVDEIANVRRLLGNMPAESEKGPVCPVGDEGVEGPPGMEGPGEFSCKEEMDKCGAGCSGELICPDCGLTVAQEGEKTSKSKCPECGAQMVGKDEMETKVCVTCDDFRTLRVDEQKGSVGGDCDFHDWATNGLGTCPDWVRKGTSPEEKKKIRDKRRRRGDGEEDEDDEEEDE